MAFGQVSLLEVCSLFSDQLLAARLLCERVALAEFTKLDGKKVERLAGIHKLASPVASADDANSNGSMAALLAKILDSYEKISNFSVSSYCGAHSAADYAELVTSILAEVRGMGFQRANPIRPRDQELASDEVVKRQVLDLVEVVSRRTHFLGRTIFVPDNEAFRRRGTQKPVPSSQITLSPRLAKTLVNLSGLSNGQTLLDPFCGSGTIISEGLLLSLNCIGIDSNPHWVAQARRNLAWLETQAKKALPYRIERGDARNLEGMEKVDGIVTEPILLPKLNSRPDSRRARRLVTTASHAYSEALPSMARVLRRGGRIIIVVPVVKTIDGSEVLLRLQDAERIGLKEFQPGKSRFEYPLRVAFESTRWIGRAVYAFERV